jgi:uncharacterized membrane protein YdjX (TVP38/TMEM64 family)
MSELSHESPSEEKRGISTIKLILGVAAVAAFLVAARQAGHYIPTFAGWVEDQGIWGPTLFIVGYAVAVVGLVPGSLLTLSGGAIFGLARGTAYVFMAAVLGSAGAFLISRYVARSTVERRIAGNPRFEAIDHAVAEQALKIVFLLRLSPAFPFSLLNYGLGLTQMRFRDYILASVGMLPGTLLYVYYGKLAGDVAALAGGVAVEKDAGYYIVLGVGLVATIVVTTFVTRLARRALAEATGT